MNSQAMCMRIEEIVTETERAMELHTLRTIQEAYGVIQEEFDEFREDVKINPHLLSSLERAQRLDRMRNQLTRMAAMCVRTMVDLEL